MLLCQQHGHDIVALANLLPSDSSQDDIDSYMYQTVSPADGTVACVNLQQEQPSPLPRLMYCRWAIS
jgi:diphthamide synthase (EF-2-diphthine--ammonia ligase)